MSTFRYIGLERLLAKGAEALAESVEQSAHELRGDVVDESPVDSGAMEDSTRVRNRRYGPRTATAQVAQGGGSVDYAVIVHQKHHDGGGGAKQVEGPLLAHAPRHRAILSGKARRKF